MEKTGLIQSIWLAFHSRGFYREVAREWNGRAFLLLLLVLPILWIPAMVRFHNSDMADFQRELNAIAENIPPIRIQNGQVTIDAEMPYVITEPDTGEEIAILDTTGKYTSLEGMEARILITSSRVHFRNNRRQIRIHDVSNVESFELTSDRAKNWIQIIRNWMAVILFPFAVALSYLWRVIQALLYALLGIAISSLLKKPLGYGPLLQLSLVAMIPAMVFKTAVQSAGVTFPFQALVGIAIVIGTLVFGIQSSAE